MTKLADERFEGADARVIHGQKTAMEAALQGAELHTLLEILVRTAEHQAGAGVLASILLLDETGHLRHGNGLSSAQELLLFSNHLALKGGFEGAVGAMLGVAAIIRGAQPVT